MSDPREKIEKLLRLAASDKTGESAAALAKARALMDKYGFCEADFAKEDTEIKSGFEAEIFRALKEFVSEKEARIFIRSHAFVNPDSEYQAGVLDGLREACSVIQSESDLFSHDRAADFLFVNEDDLFEGGVKAKEDAPEWDTLFESHTAADALFEDGPKTPLLWKKGYDEAYNALYLYLKK
ncbi:MAG TPA: DUF2786 domain-containing protein [Methanocorpusculum sp.]|nr:DUF2786 domain-containing protein [Methanocorpusculum sp.]